MKKTNSSYNLTFNLLQQTMTFTFPAMDGKDKQPERYAQRILMVKMQNYGKN